MPQNDKKASTGRGDIISEKAQERVPEVILDLTFRNGLFFIALKNIGDGPAYKVQTKFDREIYGSEGTVKINSLNLFKQIGFLAPGKEITIFLDAAYSYFNGKQPNIISATIMYYDVKKNKRTNLIIHNLEIYKKFPYVSSEPGQGS